jgi:hypothetical protein
MELILEIEVALTGAYDVKGHGMDICMLPFTAVARGTYFNGKILGEGVDTQKIEKDGSMTLSARYMMEGTDHTGAACRIFIENNGNNHSGELLCWPKIVTDSAALKEWENAKLSGKIEGISGGVIVRIYKE